MLQKIESIAIAFALGAVPVIGCFLAGWWLSIALLPEAFVMGCALAGLLAGMLVGALFLRNWMKHAYTVQTWMWMGIYLFYTAGILGFFMGVPVFNVALGLPAGFFVGRRLMRNNAGPARMQRVARQAALFTTSVLGLVCIASAWFALTVNLRT